MATRFSAVFLDRDTISLHLINTHTAQISFDEEC